MIDDLDVFFYFMGLLFLSIGMCVGMFVYVEREFEKMRLAAESREMEADQGW